jgi:hypothetical protein
VNRWGGARVAPKLTRRACRHCGVEVDTFTTEYGRPVTLDTQPPPAATDLTQPDVRGRLWEYLGHYVGWCHKNLPVRTWRELRKEHECVNPKREHESKRKHK